MTRRIHSQFHQRHSPPLRPTEAALRFSSPILATALLALAGLPLTGSATPVVPSQFEIDTVGSGFDTPTAIAFLPGGRMLVAEKRGRVYTLLNGVRSATPLWSRENEVLNQQDRGLLGIAVDPHYVTNRYLYFLYTVDPDSNGTDNNGDGFGRLTRYQVSASDSTVVDYTTRTVLMGMSWRQGPLSASPSHSIGSLRFAADGSLLVSIGDGAQFSFMDDGGYDSGAFGNGANKTNRYEDIGAFRAQSLTSLCGKVLRLDPSNGQGYPSNPYWDGTPSSIRSRVWAYGFRNPFRFTIRPGSGSTNPAAGDPGTVYLGDVGWDTWEEQNVVRTPGANLGWPCKEGFNQQSAYQNGFPGHNDCGSFGTSDNPASATAPAASWHHTNSASSNPPGLKGNAAVGGAFYTGTRYPAPYRGAYFFADYGQSWIQVATFDAADQLVSIQGFGTNVDSPVDFAADPATGDLYYLSISSSQVRRIRYAGFVPNQPPIAVASASVTVGAAPLFSSFSSAGSSDPDGDAIGVAWDFGDGAYDTGPAPSHTYPTPGSYAVVLTVTDGRGGAARDTLAIFVTANGDFPTTAIVDRFERPDGPIGGAWVGEDAALRVTNQALTEQPGGASVVWNGAGFGANQEAYVTLKAVTASAPEHNLMLKVQGTSWSTGHLEVRYDATLARISISTYHPASGWFTHGLIAPVTLVSGDQLGARAFVDGTVQVFRNGVSIGSQSIASWPFAALGGRIGLTLTDAVASRLDDFGGGDVALAANTPPTATALAPLGGSFYVEGDTIWLRGSGADAQDTPAQLEYHWQVDIHHNNHVHPSSFVSDLRDDYLIGENHDDGTGVFQVAHLVVTDRMGKKDTASVAVYPEINLIATALGTDPAQVLAEIPVEYHFNIQNAGRMPSPHVHWILHTEEAVLAEGDTLVPPLGQVAISRVLSGPSPGVHTLRAVVDSLAQVTEVDESDNAIHLAMPVGGAPLAVGDSPLALALSAPRPNPAAGSSRLTLALPAATRVAFEVFDLQGRVVWRAPERELAAGRWDLVWPGLIEGGRRAHAGLYLAVVSAGERKFVRRVARLR